MLKCREVEILKEIISFENNASLNLSFNDFINFLSINNQNKLIDKKFKFEKVVNPEITIIMIVYNQALCLHKCLRSIQNQSIKDIEIIIVDDCSLDNSTGIIKEYQNEDPRIILIKHDSNEGRIKARSDGIRKAKGKYITLIDGDDAFIHKNILKNCLYVAKKANLDVVEFKGFEYKMGNFTRLIKYYPGINLKYIIYQPELSSKFIFMDKEFPSNFANRAIWGKLIKRKLFNKILDDVGVEYTDDFINVAEDTIMVFSLLHLAKSYYLFNDIGYLYFHGPKEKVFPILNPKVCKSNDKIKNFDSFKFLKFLVEKNSHNELEEKMIYRELMSINFNFYFNNFKLGQKHYQIMFYIFDKALEFNHLEREQKDDIIKLKNLTIANQRGKKI